MAATLFAMSQRACIRNVADIDDVSDLRYEILQPILKKIENPAQLVGAPFSDTIYVSGS